MGNQRHLIGKLATAAASAAIVMTGASASSVNSTPETAARAQIAAANMRDAVVIDCQLPGKLIQLGGSRNYLTPGQLLRLSAIDCKSRGGEFTIGDLASGTLSLKRWLPLAEQGQPEAQYYVARIYANGMGGVPLDYAKAAQWYQKASAQHYASATQELGYLYEKGLGVSEDKVLALNLQRQASGLGEDLDYAWKIGAAKEEAAKQTAELSARLEAANAEIETDRAALMQTGDQLLDSRSRFAASQDKILKLRGALAAAKQNGDGASAARVHELEKNLQSDQAQLGAAQREAEGLRSQLSDQQSQLAARLANSEAASMQLNELLAARSEENTSLRARLAQSEQRLNSSRQELADLGIQYRSEVDQLTQARQELAQIKTQSKTDGGAALVAAKQRELDRQQLTVQDLQEQIARLQRAAAAPARAPDPAVAALAALSAKAAESDKKNTALSQQLTDLQGRYRDQMQVLQAKQQELLGIRSKSDSERAAVLRQMDDQLRARAEDLDGKQKRIASLEADAKMLRDEVGRFQEERTRDSANAMSDAERAREALRAAQQKISDQRDRLDQMKTDFATERAALLKDRDSLEAAVASGQREKDLEVSSLKADIHERELVIEAKVQRIAALEKEVSARPMLTADARVGPVTWRGPAPDAAAGAKTASDASQFTPTCPCNYYALVIGNSNYRFMGALVTPASDARTIAETLEKRYGFKVQLLLDATSDEIMRTLHSYTQMLTETDRMLVYYAGHGGTQDGPPERAFWLGVNADPETQDGFISAETIRGKIKQMRARHVLLVADSCFSGAITHPKTTTVGRDISLRRFQIEWSRPARMVLTSGQNTPVVDSTGDRTHSLFAKYFIQVLRQNENIISGEMLSFELSGRMQAEAARLGLKQTPTYTTLEDANHDFGDFFFIPSPTTERVAALVQ